MLDCWNRNCRELKRKILLVSSAVADSASCPNFLFCEDKIANGYSDDYAKGHKSPIFQELKLCLHEEQGRTTEESSIFIPKFEVLTHFVDYDSCMRVTLVLKTYLARDQTGWGGRLKFGGATKWNFGCDQSMPRRLCNPWALFRLHQQGQGMNGVLDRKPV